MKLPSYLINLFYFSSVFFLGALSRPVKNEGLFWQSANAFGFIAFICLLLLCINGRGHKGHSIIHRWVGIAALVACLTHVIWFLVGDPIVIEYLKPGAPPHMVFGISAFILITLLSISSLTLFRKKVYLNTEKFRHAHRYLSLAVILLSALHIIFSAYYLTTTLQIILLCALVALSYVVTPSTKIGHRLEASSLLIIALVALTIFAFIDEFTFITTFLAFLGFKS